MPSSLISSQRIALSAPRRLPVSMITLTKAPLTPPIESAACQMAFNSSSV